MGDTERIGLGRVKRSGLVVAGLVMLIGLAASGTTAALVHEAEMQAAWRVMDRTTSWVQAAVQFEMQRHVDAVGLIAAGVEAQPEITYAGFRAVSSRMNALGLSGVSAVTFVVPAVADSAAAT